jgi:MFS family permease
MANYLWPSGTTASALWIIFARGLRAFGDGFVAVLMPAYLLALGFSGFEVGLVATAMLLGSALVTLAVGFLAIRYGHRELLLLGAGLMLATGVAIASLDTFWPIIAIAFVGTLTPSGSSNNSPFVPLEHALIAANVPAEGRTALFARYSLFASAMAAVGALASGLPELFGPIFGAGELDAIRGMFLLYAGVGIAAYAIYFRLRSEPAAARAAPRALHRSRGIVIRLAALFCIDSFGGGFVVQSILALWLLQRFDLSLAATGQIFFWSGILSALSFLLAVPIARRIGLVNTMVFTHLPANICLMLIPFAPTVAVAVALLLIRALLSDMDVPTRTSYIVAVVEPDERAAASSFTAVPRQITGAISPSIAGWLLQASSFGWALFLGGAIKAIYDLALLYAFRRVKPPEEST